MDIDNGTMKGLMEGKRMNVQKDGTWMVVELIDEGWMNEKERQWIEWKNKHNKMTGNTLLIHVHMCLAHDSSSSTNNTSDLWPENMFWFVIVAVDYFLILYLFW